MLKWQLGSCWKTVFDGIKPEFSISSRIDAKLGQKNWACRDENDIFLPQVYVLLEHYCW